METSSEAVEFVRGRGGRLWVWAARPPICCGEMPAYMNTATAAPGLSGFNGVPVVGLELWFRPLRGQLPQVLEIRLGGRRHPKVEAFWDGRLIVL